MCKSFGSNLKGPTLQWYTNLPNNFISSFAHLTDTFVEQFTSSKKLEKLLGDLYHIQQRHTESLRDYVGWFNKEKVSIPFCNQETAANTFRKGLFPDGELYKDLTKFNYSTMEDALARAWNEIRWEEDELHHVRHSTSNDYVLRTDIPSIHSRDLTGDLCRTLHHAQMSPTLLHRTIDPETIIVIHSIGHP